MIVIDRTAGVRPFIQGPAAFTGGFLDAYGQAHQNAAAQNAQMEFQADARNTAAIEGLAGTAISAGFGAALGGAGVLGPKIGPGLGALIGAGLGPRGSSVISGSVLDSSLGQEARQNAQFFDEYGVTQDQATRYGQQQLGALSPELRSQVLQGAGYSQQQYDNMSDADKAGVHLRIGGQALAMQRAQYLGAAKAAQMQAAEDAIRGEVLYRGYKDGSIIPPHQILGEIKNIESGANSFRSDPGNDYAPFIVESKDAEKRAVTRKLLSVNDGDFTRKYTPDQQFQRNTVREGGRIRQQSGRDQLWKDLGVDVESLYFPPGVPRVLGVPFQHDKMPGNPWVKYDKEGEMQFFEQKESGSKKAVEPINVGKVVTEFAMAKAGEGKIPTDEDFATAADTAIRLSGAVNRANQLNDQRKHVDELVASGLPPLDKVGVTLNTIYGAYWDEKPPEHVRAYAQSLEAMMDQMQEQRRQAALQAEHQAKVVQKNQPQPMPTEKVKLVNDQTYQTPIGILRWNGKDFEIP